MNSIGTRKLKGFQNLMITFTLITTLALLTNLDQKPLWLFILQIVPLPIFLVLLSMICLDLYQKDYVTIKGELIEKKEYTVWILTENGKVKKFRANEASEIKELNLHQEIEIQYYKRTKAVIQIMKCIEPEIKNAES